MMKQRLRQFPEEEQGQDLIEYALQMAFIALSAASIIKNAGTSVHTVWVAANTQLTNAALVAAS